MVVAATVVVHELLQEATWLLLDDQSVDPATGLALVSLAMQSSLFAGGHVPTRERSGVSGSSVRGCVERACEAVLEWEMGALPKGAAQFVLDLDDLRRELRAGAAR